MEIFTGAPIVAVCCRAAQISVKAAEKRWRVPAAWQAIRQEIRITVPGHTQRGGSPCAYDRVISSRLGAAAAELILKEKYGYMVGFKGNEIVPVPLSEVAGKLKMVDPDSSIIKEAKNLGICFGDY